MGVSTNAYLIYGVDLGDYILDNITLPADFRQVCEIDEDYEIEDLDDLQEAIDDYLKFAGIKKISMHIHCSDDYRMFVLGYLINMSFRGETVAIDLSKLTAEIKSEFSQAAKYFGIRDDAQILFCSYWS